MAGCADYRSVDDRLRWFLSNDPGGVGWCARHTWRALGGDRGCPPAWGAPDANAVVAKMRAAGELRTDNLRNIPRGAVVLWEYPGNGHMALSYGPEQIATTDPWGKPAGTGIEHVTYPARFGARNGGWPTGWAHYYSGVTLTIGDEDMPLDRAEHERIAEIVANRLAQDLKGLPDAVARAVWKFSDEYMQRNVQWMVRNTYRRLVGAIDDLPAKIEDIVDGDKPPAPTDG